MIKSKKVIELLNKALAMEMTATNQYMYFHFRCSDYGYEPLAKLFKRIAIAEMMHIERIAERAFYLEGDVAMRFSEPVEQIADVDKMLAKSRQLEEGTVLAYNDFAKQCADEGDMASKRLFEELLGQEESHEDQFITEGDNLKRFGKEYLALQMIEHSKMVAAADTSVG